ncbi:MAG: hypothetical protein ACOYK7_14555 [Pirellulales bacterium]
MRAAAPLPLAEWGIHPSVNVVRVAIRGRPGPGALGSSCSRCSAVARCRRRVVHGLLIVCVGLCAGQAAGQANQAGADGPDGGDVVSFDGQTLVLASQGANDNEQVLEFIPEGEKLDRWTRLASVRVYDKSQDPKALAGGLVKQVKMVYPQAPCALMEHAATGASIVDFVVGPADGSMVEFNIFKYSRMDDGRVVAEQYAIRRTGDVRGFLARELKPLRERLLPLMAEEGLRLGEAAEAAPAN